MTDKEKWQQDVGLLEMDCILQSARTSAMATADKLIEKAILRERERCARIAETAAGEHENIPAYYIEQRNAAPAVINSACTVALRSVARRIREADHD